jgi:hypothetical protein
MADNRIYLRCKGCGKELFLGKRLGLGYYWENYGKENNQRFANDPNWEKQDDRSLEDRLNEFYDEHECCGDAGVDCFELRYESSPSGSNADRIRAMSDEELAEFLDDVRDEWGCSHYPHGTEDWLDWLKQESKI